MRSSVLCLLLCVFSGAMAKMQNVTVKGAVICNKKRLANVHVRLMEKDTCNLLLCLRQKYAISVTPDDKMAETETNRDGEFELFGQEDEVFSIEPYLVFHHDCNVKKAGCHRETKFEVPKGNLGGEYDMTYVTLDIVQYDDKEHC